MGYMTSTVYMETCTKTGVYDEARPVFIHVIERLVMQCVGAGPGKEPTLRREQSVPPLLHERRVLGEHRCLDCTVLPHTHTGMCADASEESYGWYFKGQNVVLAMLKGRPQPRTHA
jgi:hypothetical protein